MALSEENKDRILNIARKLSLSPSSSREVIGSRIFWHWHCWKRMVRVEVYDRGWKRDVYDLAVCFKCDYWKEIPSGFSKKT